MASSLTYDSLVTDIEAYSEKSDAQFVEQIPRLIMYAENRIAVELKVLGFITPVTGTLTPGSNTIPKPALWRSMVSLNITVAGSRAEVLPRAYEYCRNYAPDPTVTGAPRFYADYDYGNLLLVPTPDIAYPFEMVYYARLQPLDATTQTNWMTTNVPQLLLYASMLETQLYLRNSSKIAEWQGLYDRALAAINGEDNNRQSDRTTVRTGD